MPLLCSWFVVYMAFKLRYMADTVATEIRDMWGGKLGSEKEAAEAEAQ